MAGSTRSRIAATRSAACGTRSTGCASRCWARSNRGSWRSRARSGRWASVSQRPRRWKLPGWRSSRRRCGSSWRAWTRPANSSANWPGSTATMRSASRRPTSRRSSTSRPPARSRQCSASSRPPSRCPISKPWRSSQPARRAPPSRQTLPPHCRRPICRKQASRRSRIASAGWSKDWRRHVRRKAPPACSRASSASTR